MLYIDCKTIICFLKLRSQGRIWESQYYIDGECGNKNFLKGRGGSDVQHKNWKGKTTKDMDYNTSSRRFRPWGLRVMALSIKCDSLALRSESREERIFSSGINCMSVWEWLEWERKKPNLNRGPIMQWLHFQFSVLFPFFTFPFLALVPRSRHFGNISRITQLGHNTFDRFLWVIFLTYVSGKP